MYMESRKRREAEFHDHLRDGRVEQRWSLETEERTKDSLEWQNLKWYCIERRSLNFMRAQLSQRCVGKEVLDYCCGNGDEALFVGNRGAVRVVGIDISERSIENCRVRAESLGLARRVSFQVMDAEEMKFPDASFDLVMEYGALHHLDLRKALGEIARVMKPRGDFVFAEVLRHNPLIQHYRRGTMHLRTEWEVEHILGRDDLEVIREYFERLEYRCFHLLALAAVPLRRWRLFEPVLRAAELLDTVLLRVPWLKWQAWMIVGIASERRG